MQIPPVVHFTRASPDVDTAGHMRVGTPSWPGASVQLAPLCDSRFSSAFVLTGHTTKKARRNKNVHTAERIKIATWWGEVWCGVEVEGGGRGARRRLNTMNAYFLSLCNACFG